MQFKIYGSFPQDGPPSATILIMETSKKVSLILGTSLKASTPSRPLKAQSANANLAMTVCGMLLLSRIALLLTNRVLTELKPLILFYLAFSAGALVPYWDNMKAYAPGFLIGIWRTYVRPRPNTKHAPPAKHHDLIPHEDSTHTHAEDV